MNAKKKRVECNGKASERWETRQAVLLRLARTGEGGP